METKFAQPSFLKEWWEKGPLFNIEETKQGKLKFINAAILANANIEKVFDTILDFDNYPNFMESVAKVEILDEDENWIEVEYTIDFRFLRVIKISIKYSARMELKRPNRIDFKIIKGPFSKHYGFWELIPFDSNKTILCYCVYTDVSNVPIAKFFLMRNPILESAIGVSTSAIIVKSIKERVEKK